MYDSLPLGTLVGQYRLLETTGYGRHGYTYIGETDQGERCWLQELFPRTLSNPGEAFERFEQRAKGLFLLNHALIPAYRDLLTCADPRGARLLLVRNYVIGTNYRHLLAVRSRRQQPFTEWEIRWWLLCLLQGLQYLHERQLVHGSLSLDTIILRHDDGLPTLVSLGCVSVWSEAVQKELNFPTTVQAIPYGETARVLPGDLTPQDDFIAIAKMALALLLGQSQLSPELIELSQSSPATNHLSLQFQTILQKLLSAKKPEGFSSAASAITALLTLPTMAPSGSSNIHATPRPSSATSASNSAILSGEKSSSSPIAAPSSANVWGCWGNGLVGAALILGFGILGFVGAQMYVTYQRQQNLTEPLPADFPPLTPESESSFNPESSPSASVFSETDAQRRRLLSRQLLDLGIDENWFWQLLGPGTLIDDEDAFQQQVERYLESLRGLSVSARQKLGEFGPRERDRAKQVANQLHLSSRALYDLADSKFFYQFPEQKEQDFLSTPNGQIWSAIVSDELGALQRGETYQVLEPQRSSFNAPITEELAPGGGRAYVFNLDQAAVLTLTLETDTAVQISLYSPTGSIKLLEDVEVSQWTGTLPEKGYYEITVVAIGPKPATFRLELTLDKVNTDGS
ncbi:MAG: serine/threonine-protein kinase [Cyanobacteria bacterium P01_H01_bin.15]